MASLAPPPALTSPLLRPPSPHSLISRDSHWHAHWQGSTQRRNRATCRYPLVNHYLLLWPLQLIMRSPDGRTVISASFSNSVSARCALPIWPLSDWRIWLARRGSDVRCLPHSLIIGRAHVMHPDALARSAEPGRLPGLYRPTASRAEFTIGMGGMIFQRLAVRFREVPDIDRGLQIFRSAARPEDPSERAHLIEPRSG